MATGRLLHPDEVTNPRELVVGKRIRCHYQATSNKVGVFSGLGEATSDFIPVTGSATPNGDFYFIMVEDWNKKRILIADRVIQHTISWDTLNMGGVASGPGNENLFGYQQPYVAGTDSRISAQATYGADGPWKAFDGSLSTYWYTSLPSYNGVAIDPEGYWIQYDLGEGNERAANFLSLASLIYTGGTTTIGTWVLKGSDDGVSFDTITNGTQPNGNVNPFEYHFNNGTPYRYYRVYIRGYGNGTNVAGATEIILREYKQDTKFNLNIRLLSGGVTVADKDNQWDKYVLGSNLDGAITAGDPSVWNHSTVWSWTSTTTSPANYRAIRQVAWNNGSPGSHYAGTNVGFRPLLEITGKLRDSLILLNSNGAEVDVVDVGWVKEGEEKGDYVTIVNEIDATLSGIRVLVENSVQPNPETLLLLSVDGVTWGETVELQGEVKPYDSINIYLKVITLLGMKGNGEFDIRLQALVEPSGGG